MPDALIIIAAYLIGSVSSSILCCRLMGLPDPRGLGSGNPGATNVLRTGSRPAAALTLLGDLLKGLLPVLIARYLPLGDATVAATGLAAFLGHLYPLYFRFQGGKGVATLLGVLGGFHWLAGLIWLACWLITAALFRFSSLAALVATTLAPLYLYWLTGAVALAFGSGLMALLVLLRHIDNIRRLVNGTENRLGKGS